MTKAKLIPACIAILVHTLTNQRPIFLQLIKKSKSYKYHDPSRQQLLRFIMALIMAIEEEIEALEENHTPTVGDFDFVFEDELLPQHKCPICLLAMRNPVQTKCGHRFCESCLLESFNSARCVFGVFCISNTESINGLRFEDL